MSEVTTTVFSGNGEVIKINSNGPEVVKAVSQSPADNFPTDPGTENICIGCE